MADSISPVTILSIESGAIESPVEELLRGTCIEPLSPIRYPKGVSMTISETTESPQTSLRTYEVRTFGCQMNVHDSERMAGLLEASGYVRAAEGEEPDLVVFNTCAVRENASNRLYGHLGQLASAHTVWSFFCRTRPRTSW